MSDRRSNDLRRPLMQQSTEDLHTVEEGSYLPDSRTESVAGSEPTPSWLSERQDPLQDSPTSLSNLGMGGGRAAASRPMLKATRSMRRSAAAAAKARSVSSFNTQNNITIVLQINQSRIVCVTLFNNPYQFCGSISVSADARGL